MELGNMCFGHSRGEYPIPRGEGWEEEIARLCDAVDPKRDTSWRDYGADFENDVFAVRGYYWGACPCGHAEAAEAWHGSHAHAPDCYQTALAAHRERKGPRSSNKWYEALCEKHGIPWNGGLACAIHCTCDYERQWRAWRVEHHHAPDCPIVLPNFEYKPTGFCLTWYKYPLRDAYMNADISLAEFAKLIDRCIESARGGE